MSRTCAHWHSDYDQHAEWPCPNPVVVTIIDHERCTERSWCHDHDPRRSWLSRLFAWVPVRVVWRRE